MALGRNEIKEWAVRFSKEWADTCREEAVDLAYRPQPFIYETKRIEFLFELYDKYTAGLFAGEGKKRKKNG